MSEVYRYNCLIAACGMNCGICIGFMRTKNPCPGCKSRNTKNKPKGCKSCLIAECELLKNTESGFCYECLKYPCSKLVKLDKRYRRNYRMSMIDNLNFIKEEGVEEFLKLEESRWTCKACKTGVSVHRKFCLNCKVEL